MVEFRKDLNKALKKRASRQIVERYNAGFVTLPEVLRDIADRIEYEKLVFDAVSGDEFTMAGMTESALRKKIDDRQTWELKDYMEWWWKR